MFRERENKHLLVCFNQFLQDDVLFVFFIRVRASEMTNEVTLKLEFIPKCLDIGL